MEKILAFTRTNPAFVKRMLCRFYPWNKSLLWELHNFWDWNHLMSNTNIEWDRFDLEQFDKKGLDYDAISMSPNMCPVLLETCEEFLNWKYISSNPHINWNEELLSKYKNKLLWGFRGISSNEGIPWNESLIQKFESKIDWEGLSGNQGVEWDEDLLFKYAGKWNWWDIAEKYPWSPAFLIHIIEGGTKIWMKSDSLIRRVKFKGRRQHFTKKRFWEGVTLNQNANIWSLDFIEEYKSSLEWTLIGWNQSIPWSLDFIAQFKEEINGNWLGYPTGSDFSYDYLDKYSGRIDWMELSEDPSVPWSEELLDRFFEKWTWEDDHGIILNENFPWTIARFEKLKGEIEDWAWRAFSLYPGVYKMIFEQAITEELLAEMLRIIREFES